MKKIKSLPPIIYLSIIYTISFLAGCCCLIVIGNISEVSYFYLEEDFFHRLNNITVNNNALFVLCLWKRLSCAFFLILLSYSILGKGVCLGFASFVAFSNGFLLEGLIVKYGVQGILIYLAAILPQGILYGTGYTLLLISCIHMNKVRKSERELMNERGMYKIRVGLAIIIIILGCIGEGYLNLYQVFRL